MPNLIRSLPLIALLGLGTSVLAQDTSTEEAADSEPAATTEQDATTDATTQEGQASDADTAQTDPASGLDLGREVEEDPSYIKETYGDWQLQCFRSETGEDPCQMYQLLREDAGNPVAEFSLFKLPGNSQAVAGATIVVPLGTLLTEGLKIRVDGSATKNYNYSFCSLGGCFARIGFTQADIDAFKAGANATLIIVPAQAPDQRVEIKTSLTGFTAAFNEASVITN